MEEKFLPPWLKYPEIPRYSIGWRMGYGEDYLIKWFAMFEALDERERLEYFRNYLPIPLDWLDWVAAQFGFDDSKQMDEGKGEFKRIEWLEQHGLANFAEWMKWDDENWKEENLE